MKNTFWRFFLLLFASGVLLLASVTLLSLTFFKEQGAVPSHVAHKNEQLMRRAAFLIRMGDVREFQAFAYHLYQLNHISLRVYSPQYIFGSSDIAYLAPNSTFQELAEKALPYYKTNFNEESLHMINSYDVGRYTYIVDLEQSHISYIHEVKQRLTYIMWLGLLFIALASLLLAWYVVTPLRILQKYVLSFGQDSPQKADKLLKRSDIIGDVSRSYESMASKVNVAMQSQALALHTLSHELRTPLARLQLSASIAEDNEEKLGDLLKQVDKEVRRMDKIIGQVTHLARLDAGTELLSKDTYEVRALLDEAIAEIVCRTDVEITIADGSHTLYGDKGLLVLAMVNVLKNACQYARSQVLIETSFSNGLLTVRFSDDGDGVAEAQRAFLFDAFYQSDNGNSVKKGLGLGLSIVNKVMQLHGGTAVAGTHASLSGLSVILAFRQEQVSAV